MTIFKHLNLLMVVDLCAWTIDSYVHYSGPLRCQQRGVGPGKGKTGWNLMIKPFMLSAHAKTDVCLCVEGSNAIFTMCKPIPYWQPIADIMFMHLQHTQYFLILLFSPLQQGQLTAGRGMVGTIQFRTVSKPPGESSNRPDKLLQKTKYR